MPHFDISRITRETNVNHVEYHETLDSTNKLAAELLADLLPHSPALVLTANQTAWRGRGANAWWAKSGALTFSLVVNARDLQLPTERLPLISLAVGLAVRNTISEMIPDRPVSIKWPNDVLINERKVCGILVEQHFHTNQPVLIIGIGVNVNNSMSSAPDDMSRNATSIFDVGGDTLELTSVLISLLQQLDQTVSELRQRPMLMLSQLNSFNILQGRTITIGLAGCERTGECRGVDEDGAIVLAMNHGVERILAGTVLKW